MPGPSLRQPGNGLSPKQSCLLEQTLGPPAHCSCLVLQGTQSGGWWKEALDPDTHCPFSHLGTTSLGTRQGWAHWPQPWELGRVGPQASTLGTRQGVPLKSVMPVPVHMTLKNSKVPNMDQGGGHRTCRRPAPSVGSEPSDGYHGNQRRAESASNPTGNGLQNSGRPLRL